MKKISLTILGAILASGIVAQNTNSLPEIPAPATSPAAEAAPAVAPTAAAPTTVDTNTPAAPKPKKHIVRHKIKEPTVSLSPGTAEVAAPQVNVRGQAGLKGEAIAHLSKGESVTVLEQIDLAKHAADEPAQWVRIAYPTNAGVWVSAKYIDANGAVASKKLNLRAGPGENYSVVGVLEHGATVSQIETKGSWMKIEPPTNSYAFVAAMYLKQEPNEVAATPTPAPTEVEPAPAPTPMPMPEPSTMTPQPPPAAEAQTPPQVPQPSYDANIPRIVTHEGVVRHVGSLIAPTTYELYDPATDQNIDFLYSTTTNLDLSRYAGMRIDVTGQEDLAERFATPVLTVQKIIVIDANAVPQRVYLSPRQQQERGNH